MSPLSNLPGIHTKLFLLLPFSEAPSSLEREALYHRPWWRRQEPSEESHAVFQGPQDWLRCPAHPEQARRRGGWGTGPRLLGWLCPSLAADRGRDAGLSLHTRAVRGWVWCLLAPLGLMLRAVGTLVVWVFDHMACRIAPRPGIEAVSPAVEARILSQGSPWEWAQWVPFRLMPPLAGFLESPKVPWFSFLGHAMWLAESRFLDQGLNLGPESQP